MKKMFLLAACLLFITGCGDVKLENGKNAIVSFKEGGISAQELYDDLKELYGTNKIVSMIDTYLLDKEYDVTSDETTYIKQAIKSAESEAKENNVNLATYISYYYGLKDEAAFKDYLRLNYRRSLWIDDYGQESVTDKQINEYYETETIGDMELSHILITINTTEDATDEEKEKAEKDAYNEAKEIIAKLKKGEDFAKLAKSNSDDDDTASKGGSLGKVNVGDNEAEIIDAGKDLKVGSYTTTPIKTQYGYHIVYKSSQDEKPELDDELKTKIRAVVGKEISSEQSFYMTALIALRKKYEMKFDDKGLEESYNDYILQNTASTNSN